MTPFDAYRIYAFDEGSVLLDFHHFATEAAAKRAAETVLLNENDCARVEIWHGSRRVASWGRETPILEGVESGPPSPIGPHKYH